MRKGRGSCGEARRLLLTSVLSSPHPLSTRLISLRDPKGSDETRERMWGMTVIGQTKRPRVAAPFTVIHPAPRSFGSSLSAPCLRRSPFGSTSRPLRGE